MRKLKDVPALAESDRQARERESAPILHQWTCGDVKVTVDAALRIMVVTSDAHAVVADVAELIGALSTAREFAAEAEQVVAAALLG